MSVKPTKTNTVVLLVLCIGLCIGLSFGFFGGIGIGRITTVAQPDFSSRRISPIRGVDITIDPSQRDELFTQLRKFADKWNYAVLIKPDSLNSEKFLIQLWRSDIKASGIYPNDPGTLSIGFFYTDPAAPVPDKFFDEEIADLEIFISEIPGATLTVEKP